MLSHKGNKMKTISKKEIQAMADVIQYAENVGTLFITDNEAIQYIEEAIEMPNQGKEGLDYSSLIMQRAVELAFKKRINEAQKKAHDSSFLYPLDEMKTIFKTTDKNALIQEIGSDGGVFASEYDNGGTWALEAGEIVEWMEANGIEEMTGNEKFSSVKKG